VTRWPLAHSPAGAGIYIEIRSATVVFPLPGLPLKGMLQLGAPVATTDHVCAPAPPPARAAIRGCVFSRPQPDQFAFELLKEPQVHPGALYGLPETQPRVIVNSPDRRWHPGSQASPISFPGIDGMWREACNSGIAQGLSSGSARQGENQHRCAQS